MYIIGWMRNRNLPIMFFAVPKARSAGFTALSKLDEISAFFWHYNTHWCDRLAAWFYSSTAPLISMADLTIFRLAVGLSLLVGAFCSSPCDWDQSRGGREARHRYRHKTLLRIREEKPLGCTLRVMRALWTISWRTTSFSRIHVSQLVHRLSERTEETPLSYLNSPHRCYFFAPFLAALWVRMFSLFPVQYLLRGPHSAKLIRSIHHWVRKRA